MPHIYCSYLSNPYPHRNIAVIIQAFYSNMQPYATPCFKDLRKKPVQIQLHFLTTQNRNTIRKIQHNKNENWQFYHYFSYRPRKHCQRGRFCVARSESLEPKSLAKSRTTAKRSSPSLLWKSKNEKETAIHYLWYLNNSLWLPLPSVFIM